MSGVFIQTRAHGLPWTYEGCNERAHGRWLPYASKDDALKAIERLKSLGADWAAAEYRVKATKVTREMFEAAQAQFRAKSDELDNIYRVLRRKYGETYRATRTERDKVDRKHEALDRIGKRILLYLDAISPRDWHAGVPWHWVCSKLTWEDALRPTSEPLANTPPIAYGCSAPKA